MFRKIKNILAHVYTDPSRHHLNIKSLAKLEYGKDWEYAYHELVNGRTPMLEVK